MNTLIKICGITREEDARAAVGLGVHALGLIFYPPSGRNVSYARARAIIQVLPPFVTTVGVVVNMDPREVETLLNTVPINLLQLHGDEPPQLCRSYGFPYIKALRVTSIAQAAQAEEAYSDARALLLDTLAGEQYGGTGETFPWERLPGSMSKPVILAGGLDAANVSRAIRTVRPYAVDVSTGVERSKGVKDVDKVRRFVEAVRDARAD